MGQKQLLYIALGVILVVGAITGGFSIYEAYYEDRIIDEMILLTQKNMDDAWTFFKTPEELGGGGTKTFDGWKAPEQMNFVLDELKNMEKQNRGFKKYAQIHFRLNEPNKIYLRGRQYDDGRRELRIFNYNSNKWKTILTDIVE